MCIIFLCTFLGSCLEAQGMVFFPQILELSIEHLSLKYKFEQVLLGRVKVGNEVQQVMIILLSSQNSTSKPYILFSKELILDDYILHCDMYNRHLQPSET